MRKQYTIKQAQQRIQEYFLQANTKKNSALIKKARTLAMKYRIKLSKELKRQYCSHCYILFIPGKNYRVRTAEGSVVYTCLSCNKYTRFSYKTHQKKKRREHKPNKLLP